MTLSYLANLLTSPLVHVPVMLGLLRILAYLGIIPRVIKWLYALPVIWLLMCSLMYPSIKMIQPLENDYPVIHLASKEWRKADIIVVLACNYFEDDGLPFVSRWPNCSIQRNLQAALMHRTKPLPILLAGQVLGKNDTQAQAEHNRYFFQTLGVADQHITTVPIGRNTKTEVAAMAPYFSNKTVALVTSASHMRRAMGYMQNYDVNVIPIPVEHLSRIDVSFEIGLPSALSLYRSERAIHEYLGLFYQNYLQ